MGRSYEGDDIALIVLKVSALVPSSPYLPSFHSSAQTAKARNRNRTITSTVQLDSGPSFLASSLWALHARRLVQVIVLEAQGWDRVGAAAGDAPIERCGAWTQLLDNRSLFCNRLVFYTEWFWGLCLWGILGSSTSILRSMGIVGRYIVDYASLTSTNSSKASSDTRSSSLT